jgi:septal ring factor EnvC (AmiA/AmiB activator)
MKWRKSSTFCLFAAVLLFLSSVCFSEVCLTDAEFQELSDNLEQLDLTLTEQATLIASQAKQLTTAQVSISLLDKQIAQARDSYNAAEKYWIRQRREVGILGSAIGLIVGVVATIIVVLTR